MFNNIIIEFVLWFFFLLFPLVLWSFIYTSYMNNENIYRPKCNLPSLAVPINSSNIALICSWADIFTFHWIYGLYGLSFNLPQTRKMLINAITTILQITITLQLNKTHHNEQNSKCNTVLFHSLIFIEPTKKKEKKLFCGIYLLL